MNILYLTIHRSITERVDSARLANIETVEANQAQLERIVPPARATKSRRHAPS